jgi:hypothetical protein
MALVIGALALCATAQQFDQVVIVQAVKHDTSPVLSDLVPGPRNPERQVVPLFKVSRPGGGGGGANFTDPVLQSATSGSPDPSSFGFNFQGVGNGVYGYTTNYAPPDTNGAVGTYQYVQWVNVDFAVWNKSTLTSTVDQPTPFYGPVPANTIWSGFGGSCQNNNGGDPIVQFDKINKRWIMMQIQYSGFGGGGGNYLCIAVSNGDDWSSSNFAFNRYAFKFNALTDYPKMGVWNDGYYVTFNAFKGFGTFAGPVVCAFNGATMRAGGGTTPQCVTLSTSYFSLLPGDTGSASQAPVAGEPEYLVSMGNNALLTWRFHVDWNNSANSLLTGPQNATTASSIAFQTACGGGTCIPQSGTTQQLDSLGDRLMYRLAYRNFGAAESLVVNHSVQAYSTGATGVRWYELRNAPSTNYRTPTAPSVYQAGTYAPSDGNYRWMGSVAMDAAGNIAVGYSVSSSSMHPSIYVASRCAADTLGQLRPESRMQLGGGSQNGSLSRWGDYSGMSIDPSDGSLWFTTEYLTSDGSFNWHTRIGKFTITCP